MALDPVSVALKFGFLIVLYLFLLWVARSALKDLRREARTSSASPAPAAADATAMHAASQGMSDGVDIDPRLCVESGSGLREGDEYDLLEGLTMGRSDQSDLRLEDPFASSLHARVTRQGNVLVLEDMNSTNGTLLNGEPLTGPQPLHAGDRIRIGDTEFSYRA